LVDGTVLLGTVLDGWDGESGGRDDAVVDATVVGGAVVGGAVVCESLLALVGSGFGDALDPPWPRAAAVTPPAIRTAAAAATAMIRPRLHQPVGRSGGCPGPPVGGRPGGGCRGG
jgi:hypothetical protein